MSRSLMFKLICLYTLAASGCTDNQTIVVNDHYGVCTSDSQCPGTSVCLDGVCVDLEEPPPDCEQYDWAGRQTPWYCWCEGNCIDTDAELPWSCSLDLLDEDPHDGVCGVQCQDHFWLDAETVGLDPDTSPPSLTFDIGTGVVTCTQYADISPLRFVRSGTIAYLLATNNRVVNIDFKLTKPGVVMVNYRTNPGNPWIYGGVAFTYSMPPIVNNIGNIQYYFPIGGLPAGTRTYWRLEARAHVNDFSPNNDIWEGSIDLP